jgi:AAA+ ATPase superfamily predicted ATPase
MPSLVVVQGRRRIGKSRLIQEFAKRHRFLQFSGLPPQKEMTPQGQRDEFARQLHLNCGLPEVSADDWSKLFLLLAKFTAHERVIILLDEISWMGSLDPDFLGKLKNAWDLHFKENPQLILILCGSVSIWIEENILRHTGFVGRISLILTLKEFSLFECNQFLDQIGSRTSPYDRLKLLSVTGGVPRYLEEIHGSLSSDENIRRLCFRRSGILFREFDNIFSDLFSKKSHLYKQITHILSEGATDFGTISKRLKLGRTGHLSDYLENLIKSGFVTRDFTWDFKSGKISRLSHYRLSDNYLRFYLKYIEKNTEKIEKDDFEKLSPSELPGWETILGLQFENLVLNNRRLIQQKLRLNPSDMKADNPYFQRKTNRNKGCQIDYLIQTKFNNIYLCEIKFKKDEIKPTIVSEMKSKMEKLTLPRNFSCWPVLIHVNGVQESILESGFFTEIIDWSEFLV